MKTKVFRNYEKACEFQDKVGGQIQWGSDKGEYYWTVWWSVPCKKGANNETTTY